MDALDISYRLRRLGKTQSQIARELGVRQGVVNNVIHDRSTAHGVAAYIAQLLECRVEDLWPERYRFKPRGPARNRRAPASLDQSPPKPDSKETNMS